MSQIYSDRLNNFIEFAKISDPKERSEKIGSELLDLFDDNHMDEMDFGRLIEYKDETTRCDRYKVSLRDHYTRKDFDLKLSLQKIGIADDPNKTCYFFVLQEENCNVHMLNIGFTPKVKRNYITCCDTDRCMVGDRCDECKKLYPETKEPVYLKTDTKDETHVPKNRTCYDLYYKIKEDDNFIFQVCPNILTPGHTSINHCLHFFTSEYDKLRGKKIVLYHDMIMFFKYHPEMKKYHDQYKAEFLLGFDKERLWLTMPCKNQYNTKCVDKYFKQILQKMRESEMTEEQKKSQIDWNSTGSVLTFLAQTMQGFGKSANDEQPHMKETDDEHPPIKETAEHPLVEEINNSQPTEISDNIKQLDDCTDPKLNNIQPSSKRKQLVAKRNQLLKELRSIDSEISKCPEDIIDFSKIS